MFKNKYYLFLIYILLFLKMIVSIIIPIKYITRKIDKLFFKFYLNRLSSNININKSCNEKISSTIFVMNHYTVHDVIILSYLINDLYFVAKDDIFSSNYKSSLLTYISEYIYKLFKLIPYKRGDKKSGKICRQNIINVLNKGHNICIFPEGGSTYYGIPKKFYNGIFEIALEHNFDIYPCSIKYDPPVGINPGEKLNILKDLNLNPKIDLNIMDKISISKYNKKINSSILNKICYKIIVDKLK